MAAPASPIDIYNLALLLLYQKPIQSFQDAGVAAATGNLIYDQVRQNLLYDYQWNFARVRAYFPLVANSTPPFDYQAFYQVPNDCLRINWVGEDFNRIIPFTYDVQARTILLNPNDPAWETSLPSGQTQQPNIPVLYTTDCTDPSLFSPGFINCLKYALAAEACMPITGDLKLKMYLDAKFEQEIVKAQAVNHMERPVRVTDVDRIANARILDMELLPNTIRVDLPSGD